MSRVVWTPTLVSQKVALVLRALILRALVLFWPFTKVTDAAKERTGTAIPSTTPLLPCGILAFGLPRPSLLKTEMACPPAWHDHQQQQQQQQRATITLADIGFPPTIWDRVGVEGFPSGEVAAIWGAELLVEVERGHPAP